jgi:Golgi phosphoprotein 3 GPP34
MTGVTSRQLQSAPTVVSTAKPDGATTKETKAVTTPREPNDVSELSIAEQLVLVARVGSRARPAPLRLRYGVLAGVLVDLERAGRLQMAVGNVTQLDPTATGDALADSVLDAVSSRDRIGRLAKLLGPLDRELPGLADALTRRLEARRLLERREVRLFGVVRLTRYDAVGPAYASLRQRLHDVVVRGQPADPTAASVISLAQACGLLGRLLDRQERRAHASRIVVIRDTAADAVVEAARAVEDAQSAAAVGGIVASTAGQG